MSGKKKHEGITYGNAWMHKTLIKLLKVVNIRVFYVFMYIFVIPFTLVFSKGSRLTCQYFRCRRGYGLLKSLWATYRNHCIFGETVIDKFAMYAGKHFHIDIEGYEHYHQLASQPEAFIQLSSHIGNYEIAGYTLKSEKPFNALVFSGEKQSVMENRSEMFADKNNHMILVKEDMNHLFLIDNALQKGEIVSMPADRFFGSSKSISAQLLGAEIKLPLGPFSVATMRGYHVLTVNVMKSSATSYKIFATPLEYDKELPRKKQIEQLAHGYVAELERMLRMYPTQWYNFFDYWKS